MGTILKGNQLAASQDLSMDFQTESIPISHIDVISFTVNCTSVTSNTGSFGLQFSSTEKDDRIQAPWIDLTLDTIPVLADADDNFVISASELGSGQVRLIFTGAGADGVAEIWVSGKKKGRI